jgi:hypothetical protein
MAKPRQGPPDPDDAGDTNDKIAKLEARIAKVEDRLSKVEEKLSRLCVTEEEWKAYQKVNSVLAGAAGLPRSTHGECPAFIIPIDHSGPCRRCSFIWIASCAVPPGGKVGGADSDPDFSGLGGSS